METKGPILTPEEWAMPLDEFVNAVTGYAEWARELIILPNESEQRITDELVVDGKLTRADRLKLAVRWLHEAGLFRREDVALLVVARDAGRIEGGHSGHPARMVGRPLTHPEQVRLGELRDLFEQLMP